MPNLPNSQKTNTSIQKTVRKIQPQVPLILVVIMAMVLIGIGFWNARPKPTPIIPTATTEPTITPAPTRDIVAGATPIPYEELTQDLERSLVWIESTPRTRFAPEHGTGVILSADGLVLTNAHVISFGDISGEITVALVVGSRLIERQVEIIGIAPCEDLALLDMVGDDYIPIPTNPDPSIGLGTEIFILGYGQSTLSSNVSIGFARGEISRTLVTFSPYQALIEHTAELLPSDSGSPLFNRRGEMIGVNTLMDVQGCGRRASYAIAQARIQTTLAYLQIQEAPPINYELGLEGDMPIHRLTDYFDRHCYTLHIREASTLLVSAPPQESHLFSPMLSVYDAKNQLMVPPTRLSAEANYTTAITIPTAGSYTVVIGRESTTTSGADKLGDYTLSIRQEN